MLNRRLALAVVAALAPALVHAQVAPLSVAAMTPYVGTYAISDGPNTMPLRVFVADGALMGQLRTNAPTKLRYLGASNFQPEDAPEFTLRFTLSGNTAAAVVVENGDMRMSGLRVSEEVAPAADPTASGPLFDALAQADSLLFDASFATCDYTRAAAFLAPDIEFYHDLTGFHAGNVVRDDFRSLTTNCPAKKGVRREVVRGSVRVYPIKDFGAVQMGEHVFREARVSTYTAARFVHLWRNVSGRWVLSRVMSFDHQPIANR
jgi:Domain of unknown function (DUF4440)